MLDSLEDLVDEKPLDWWSRSGHRRKEAFSKIGCLLEDRVVSVGVDVLQVARGCASYHHCLDPRP